MKNYGTQRSTVKPEPMTVDDFSVWIHSNITSVAENEGQENEFVGFTFEKIQYEKDEFIAMQAEKSVALEIQVTDTQLALVELYEGMV